MTEVCENCRPLFEKLLKRIEELERRLAAYENSHTPYSRRIFRPRPRPTNGKIGRPSGLPGSTRPTPNPDRKVEKTFNRCPNCDSRLKHIRKESVIIEEIPNPQPIEVVEYVNNHYECKNCGEVVAKDENCPKQGRFGNNVLAHCTLMKFEDRLTFRKLHSSLKRHYNLDITPASIMNMTRNVFRKLEPEHEELVNTIRSSPCVYADETSMRINGINNWIWIFVAENAVLCVIRKSRSKKVVKEILGDYTGVLVCDGWKSYAQFGFTIQRCWAHLLREANDTDNKELYESLCRLFADAKSGLKRDVAEERLWKIISTKYDDEKSMKLMNKIKNGFHRWFTFLTYKFVEPTNNTAEQALREHVVIRKIIGGLRSLEGAKVHEVVMSCLATWKLKNLDMFDTLVSYLRS